jgi:UPF0176 protein
MQESPYIILAFYHFITLEDPRKEVARHKSFFENRDVTCRIYISEQGINGQMSAARKDGMEYIEWMQSRPEFAQIHFKIHNHHEQVFPRLTVKYRKQLVALDSDVDLDNRGEYTSPDQWKKMLEDGENRILLDVRNEYESRIGHFEGAELPPCDTFREFSDYADQLKDNVDPKKTPVMMYCTGGIRCELYSAVLKSRGFEKIYQLEGGIINYGLKHGSAHWLGKLFVFDDRLAVPISGDVNCEEERKVIGKCHHCSCPNEIFYNCANMKCNALFLCCPDCLVKFKGCCKESCQDGERVRPYNPPSEVHKPFRRMHHYQSCSIKK